MSLKKNCWAIVQLKIKEAKSSMTKHFWPLLEMSKDTLCKAFLNTRAFTSYLIWALKESVRTQTFCILYCPKKQNLRFGVNSTESVAAHEE